LVFVHRGSVQLVGSDTCIAGEASVKTGVGLPGSPLVTAAARATCATAWGLLLVLSLVALELSLVPLLCCRWGRFPA
jgi:hypothetical protein